MTPAFIHFVRKRFFDETKEMSAKKHKYFEKLSFLNIEEGVPVCGALPCSIVFLTIVCNRPILVSL